MSDKMSIHPKAKKVIVKRKYSRAGCAECKRRKIKCDEARPSCSICIKAHKACVYPVVKRKTKARARNELRSEVETRRYPTEIEDEENYDKEKYFEAREGKEPTAEELLLFENVFDDANTLISGLIDFESFAVDFNPLMPDGQAETNQDIKPFHSDILINEDPKSRVLSKNAELESYLQGTDILNNPELAKSWYQFDLSMRDGEESHQVEDTSNKQLTQRIVQIHGLTPTEVEYFESIAFGNFVTYVFPFAANKENNEVMRVLLEYLMVFKYLVYALMSVKAACDFISTDDPIHDQQQRKFTAICMRLLVAAFADLKNNEFSLWHIEGLILTVLTLTMLFSEMSFVDTTKAPVSWIVHLQEARALLIKYNSIKAQNPHRKPDSPGITLAKQIFFCYDWSSKMSLQVSDIRMEDLDDLLLLIENAEFLTDDPIYIRTLTKMGMMIPATNAHTDFHTFTTINSVILKIMYKLIELMSLMNNDKATAEGKKQISPQNLSHLMSLINEAMSQKIVPGISGENSFQISLENPAHPFYTEQDKIYLPECAYGLDSKDSGDVYYSWCDVALSLHACFLYLKVLTSPGLLYLPRSHPMIKLLIKKVLQTLFFVKLKDDPSYMRDEILEETDKFYLPKCLFDYRAIMIQLPFRLLIDLTDDETDFEKLELYFKGLLRFGCGSSSLAINRIQEKREISKTRSSKTSNFNASNDLDYETAIYPIY